MTITITATDVNADGTGINLLTYLTEFANDFVASGRGQFSGANGISGEEYAATDSSGYGVVFGSDDTAWSYNMTTHTVTGSLDAVTFGSAVTLDTTTRTFTQTTEVAISGLDIDDSSLAEGIRGELTGSTTTLLLDYLKTESLVFKGSSGSDVFRGYDFADRLEGGSGNDTLVGGGGADVLLGQNGNDIAKGGMGNDTIKGGLGNDKIYGEAGNDKLYGEAGNDGLNGGAGNDRLTASLGNDTLTGGAGTDTFLFGTTIGRTVITDFAAGKTVSDVLVLEKSLLSSFANVTANATENSLGVTIDYGDGSIVLKGVELADLHRNDFFFV
jgi:serralysin